MNQLVTVLPVSADIPRAYEQGSDDEQEFVQNLAIFLTGFLKVPPHCRLGMMGKLDGQPLVLTCMFSET